MRAMLFGLQPARWHPLLYRLSVWQKRTQRKLEWHFGSQTFASARALPLPTRIYKHSSKLIRGGCSGPDLQLQLGKVQNLKAAIPHLTGLVVKPGETFSFCKTVGKPTRARGFTDGMELSLGVARTGVGGGLCQLSNLIHWLVLHSPLTVVERHHHSFDPFPDEGRALPFGSGATVFFNYRDFRFRNDTRQPVQLRLWLTDKLVEGELRTTEPLPFSYSVQEREHRFVRDGDRLFRTNELWREVRHKTNGAPLLRTEKLFSNYAEVKYRPAPGTPIQSSRAQS
jgi:vancomycin resistance protein VanW